MPQPQVRTFKGKRVLLDEFLGDGFSLIGFNCNPYESLSAENKNFLQQLDTRYVTLYPFGGRPQGEGVQRNTPASLVEVEDADGSLVEWFSKGLKARAPIAIIRPDRFVFALVDVAQLEAAIDQLKEQLGWKPGLSTAFGEFQLRESA